LISHKPSPAINMQRRRTCDTHCSTAVWWIVALSVGVHPSYTATRATSQILIFPSAFSTLFCYSGWSQIVQIVLVAYLLS